MLVQFSDRGDSFLHQLAAEGVEAFGAVELLDWLVKGRKGLKWRYLDDSDLAGDF